MEKVVIDFFKKHNLDLVNKTIVVAVSTGVDSMALLGALNSIKDEFNLSIHIAHVNHQMREASKEEEEYIKEYAKSNNLNIHIMHLEKKQNVNFQEYARTERYKFFERVMREVNGDYLLLAHHATDNIETILMRIIRGSSLEGYAGIAEIMPWKEWAILRPFLNVLKKDLYNYVNLHNIKYYEDESNKSKKYTRNRIRQDILPLLFLEDENVHLKFNEFANIIKNASNIVNNKVNEIIAKFIIDNDSVSFHKDLLLNESDFLKEEILFSVLKKYELSKANIEELIKLISSNKKNLKLIYKNKFTFVKEYDMIYIFNKLIKNEPIDVVINEVGTYYLNDTIEINVMKTDSIFIHQPNDLWYNSNMLPIRIRSRRPGDKILLEAGYKKVKDLLIDLKVGILQREKVLLLEKDGEILAVIGFRKSILLKEIKQNDIVIRVRN